MYLPGEFLRDNRGSVIVTFAVSMIVVLGFAALAVDLGYWYLTRGTLQRTADAAALAGASQLPDAVAVRDKAQAYAAKNMDAAKNGTVLADGDVVVGNWDPDTRQFDANGLPINAVKVTTRRSDANGNSAPTFFTELFGFEDVDIEASAVATFGNNDRWDIVIVQDVTTSFTDEIGDARDADQALLDCLRDNADPQSLIGLVAFTGVATTVAPLDTIGSSYNDLSAAVSDLDPCGQPSMPICSGTHVGAGMEEAVDLFDGIPQQPDIGRAMVIVGDGTPNASGPNAGMTNEQLQDIARQAADAADAIGISVFPVFYDQNNDDAGADFFRSLERGRGKLLRTPDSSELPNLLFQICGQLSLKLVE